MSFRMSERSMQTCNNKTSVSSKDSKSRGTVQFIEDSRLYVELKVSEF